mmetsp:Transcript_10477/g.19626  ORF Transcript_10477/g.19626 Transcript_10477/m.19626 type:complete len:94 (-) Transcript_10477:3074-3355(-)
MCISKLLNDSLNLSGGSRMAAPLAHAHDASASTQLRDFSQAAQPQTACDGCQVLNTTLDKRMLRLNFEHAHDVIPQSMRTIQSSCVACSVSLW